MTIIANVTNKANEPHVIEQDVANLGHARALLADLATIFEAGEFRIMDGSFWVTPPASWPSTSWDRR